MRLPEPLFLKGDKRGILLLHAYSGTSNDVRMLARRLQEQNYTVYCPLFTGHGTGDPLDILQLGSIRQWQDDAEAGYRYLLAQGCREVSVFGLSLGGIFAAYLLEMFPELKTGGVFSSPLFQTSDSRVQEAFVAYAEKQLADEADFKQKAELGKIKQLLPQQLFEIAQFAEKKVLPALARIKQPFLIAQGGADELIDAQLAYQLKAQFIPQQVTFKWYPTAGHVITVNSAHHQLANDLIEFLGNNEEKK